MAGPVTYGPSFSLVSPSQTDFLARLQKGDGPIPSAPRRLGREVSDGSAAPSFGCDAQSPIRNQLELIPRPF